MLTVPLAVLEQLKLKAGDTVGLVIDGDSLILKPHPKPRYTLDELLAKCDYSQPLTTEDREWIDAPPVGRELL
jgi:antitoxin ChpS